MRNSRETKLWLKFMLVGALGVAVNLLVISLIIRLTGCKDWRASSAASIIASVHNYVLNNRWTFQDRRRRGKSLFSGALMYLLMSGIGILTTTAVYATLAWTFTQRLSQASSIYPLIMQLLSIACGTYLNYALNSSFTWSPRRGFGPRRAI
jgi:dolichol-phosphate mannosyltransferase